MSERWFPDTMPPPAADNDTGAWWQAACEHRLVVQRCEDCGVLRHPPRPMCAACQSLAWDTTVSSGRGTVF